MRIVGGELKGRRLEAPEGRNVRPTSDRARESLFNILTQGRVARNGNPLADARVLDGFAGSGALGIEALSRGAAEAFFLEMDRDALAVLRRNLATLNLGSRARVVPADILSPPRAVQPCDILFLDPPYRTGLAEPAFKALAAAGWIAPGALISLETARNEDFEAPAGYTQIDKRHYGNARLVIFQYEADEP